MNAIQKVLLGASWKTTVTGYIEAALIAGLDYATTASWPDDPAKQKIFFGGISIAVMRAVSARLQKDSNVSNSPIPGPPQQTTQPP